MAANGSDRIAQALYGQASVLVFDEATSALDNDTEQAVMDSIDGLSKAHDCDDRSSAQHGAAL